MPAYLSPIGNEQQSDANGAPLSGGLIQTYQAGTSTPVTTYTDQAGLIPQANPIVLNSAGLPANPIWLPAGQAVKLVIQNAQGVTQRTVDNVLGINDPSAIGTPDQWVVFSGAATFLSATSFSVAGDQTPTFQISRRVRSSNTGGVIFSTIRAVSFAAGVTTVTVANDSGSLDSGLSQVAYGLLSPLSPSVPVNYLTTVRGYLAGLTLSTAGSSTTFSVAAGAAADSATSVLMTLATALNKTTAAWAVGTGNGALDTGAIAANSWYHVYLIRRPDTGVVDVLVSRSPTAPALPSGYTQSRRIGSMRTTDASQWSHFTQDGDLFQWVNPVLDVNVNAPGSAAVLRTLTVPLGFSVRAFLNAGGTSTAGGDQVYLSDPATNDFAPSSTAAPLTTTIIGANISNYSQAVVRTNTSAQIRSRMGGGTATETLRIATLGWFDTRGRDS